jgi:class 3 adenylate cyclase
VGWLREMTAAALVCGSCGTELPPDSRFCNKCGAPIRPAATSAEYKQVTVLFADVVHSMDIAVAVGAERLREIMTELVDRSSVVVLRYGGTVDKFTGDGIMAVFGAPTALEDHAVRACLAALGVQEQAKRLAVDVQDRDGVDLQLRVGLNSGRVIAGEIGSGALGYTTVGEQVGMAQRMESVAPPGGVMLSASTARLVEGAAALTDPELVQIKGADGPVPARRLLSMGERPAVGRAESNLVGRRWELSAVESLLDRAIDGHGTVVGVVGSPGIGKSRLVREVAALAGRRDVDVFIALCESHTNQVHFHAVARLLRAGTGVEGLDGQTARDRVRDRVPDADPEDLLLFHDLLGIADPEVKLPKIDPDARRRRLTALVNAMSLARKSPALYVIEDAHWIDEVSESMLAEFLTVVPQTPSLVLVTYRPEYEGALARVHSAQTIALAPLSDSETAALVSQLLGLDPSAGVLGQKIAEKAAGNPFFAEEIVRELAERGVLRGQRGAYMSAAEVGEVSVPATLQATIAARIDRLDPVAKRTLSAAAVVGSRFSRGLLEGLGIEPALDDLVRGQFLDQITFTRDPEYVFHHPLIRTVAYESQLKSDRARLHSRLAAAIEAREPESADQNAVLIAEHLEAAGDLLGAYDWHMRAGAWSTTRDTAAARASWDRAAQISDALSDDHPDRLAMRIAARTLLCGSAWRVHADASDRFDELSTLCTAAGDKASLAIGMTGLVGEHYAHVRIAEASRLASEQMTLIQSIGDPLLTIALAPVLCVVKHEAADFGDVLRWSQAVIDLADGDPTKGDMFIGSPLCWALAQRGQARWALNQPGWQDDFDRSIAMASRTDAVAYAYVVNAIYTPAVSCGVLVPDDSALYLIEEVLRIAERTADDVALGMARTTLGIALVFRDSVVERERGLELLEQLRDMCLHERYFLSLLQFGAVYIARERSRHGDQDGALALMREAVDGMHHTGHLGPFAPCTGVLVETLLARGSERDIAEAAAAIDRLVAAPVNGFVVRDIILLRLRALMSSARGDNATYRDFRHRYREMATSLGFEGHIAWAEAMP